MLNPHANIARSKGIDLPILYVYNAGRVCGEHINQCISWQKKLIEHYKNYEFNQETENYDSYPVSFLSALNSKEGESVDKSGLTSKIPPNLIYSKDILSLITAHAIVANVDDMLEIGIEEELTHSKIDYETPIDSVNWRKAFFKLQDKILNRRENWGTISEISIAIYLQKPVILIVPERRQEIYKKHPFASRASVIVTSVDQLIKEKWIEILYKSIASSIYE